MKSLSPQKLKKSVINIMIGSLIGAAVIAVVAVLLGEFNDLLGKALFTMFVVTLHALVSLGFLEGREKDASATKLTFFTNTVFVIIILSFLTAIFGTWGLLDEGPVGRLYATYFVLAFGVLHGELLYKIKGLTKLISNIAQANVLFMALVTLLLLPIIWTTVGDFPDFYYRALAASAIIDGTLTILAVILSKLYLQKNPTAVNPITLNAAGSGRRRLHPLVIILIAFLLLQLVSPAFYWIFNSFFWR